MRLILGLLVHLKTDLRKISGAEFCCRHRSTGEKSKTIIVNVNSLRELLKIKIKIETAKGNVKRSFKIWGDLGPTLLEL